MSKSIAAANVLAHQQFISASTLLAWLVMLVVLLVAHERLQASATSINIWKHRYPFWGGYGFGGGYPYGGGGYGFGTGYGGISIGGAYGGYGR